jgi:hypothetical protein
MRKVYSNLLTVGLIGTVLFLGGCNDSKSSSNTQQTTPAAKQDSKPKVKSNNQDERTVKVKQKAQTEHLSRKDYAFKELENDGDLLSDNYKQKNKIKADDKWNNLEAEFN